MPKHYPDGHPLEIYDDTTFVRQSLESYLGLAAQGGTGLTSLPGICGFRLTLQSGTPVTRSDLVAQGVIYMTPYGPASGLISLYDGVRWNIRASAEFSLSLTGLTSGKNYDIFVFDNAGVPTIELSAPWTTNNARADALALQNGINVKSVNHTRLYVGTMRATGATTTEDSGVKRFLWSYWNRAPKLASKFAGASHAYASATVRQWNADAANQIEFVIGFREAVFPVTTLLTIIPSTVAATGQVGFGVNSTTAFWANASLGGMTVSVQIGSTYSLKSADLTDGYHTITMLESAAAGISVTFSQAEIQLELLN